MIGSTLSRYRIIRPVGAGGMCEVYRAHDLVVSENSIRGSRGGSMVVLEEPPEAIGRLNGALPLRRWPSRNLVSQPLIAPFPVVVRHVLPEGPLQGCPSHEDHLIQALGSDGPHEPLGVGFEK
jgi:serine/threonine protein kinase